MESSQHFPGTFLELPRTVQEMSWTCHQILPENGYVRPGEVVVGTDSHTTSHGALGAFAFGIGATEMAAVWTLGHVLNVEVPATIKVNVTGKFQKDVSGNSD